MLSVLDLLSPISVVAFRTCVTAAPAALGRVNLGMLEWIITASEERKRKTRELIILVLVRQYPLWPEYRISAWQVHISKVFPKLDDRSTRQL
jgi:hypothetical protein